MKTLILILCTMLLLTNSFWFYTLMDNGVAATYQKQTLHEEQKMRKQLSLTLVDVSARLPKEEVIAIATKHTDQEIFEKDGCVWVGELGLKFDANERLEHISPPWSYEADPCNPN
jgi:hypothetical protein